MTVLQPTHVGTLFYKGLQRGVGGGAVLVSVLRGVAENRREEVKVPEGNGTSGSGEQKRDSAMLHRWNKPLWLYLRVLQ